VFNSTAQSQEKKFKIFLDKTKKPVYNIYIEWENKRETQEAELESEPNAI